MARKAWLLVAGGERSNNKNLAFWRARSPLLRWPIWPGWALIMGLAVVGFMRSDLSPRKRWLLLGSACLYGAALLLFFINIRFRLPVLAWLVVPAGGGLVALVGLIGTRSRQSLPRFAAPLGLLVALLSFAPDAFTRHEEAATEFESWRSLGNSYLSVGDETRAIATWRQALAVDDEDPRSAHRWTLPEIYQPMVQLFNRRGQTDAAIAVQRLWVVRLPDSPQARLGLANLLLQADHVTEAIAELNIVVAQSPENIEARLGLGWAYYQDQQFEAALNEFRTIAIGAEGSNAQFGIGLALIALGEYDTAEEQLKSVLATSPGFWQVYENLAILYERTGRPTEELRSWSQVLTSQPQHRRARERVAYLRRQTPEDRKSVV